MIHYTCDRCKRAIDPETEARYIVEIDVRLASTVQPRHHEADDLDQLAELHEQLERENKAEIGSVLEDVVDAEAATESLFLEDVEDGPEQYDLCHQCHQAFTSNPLGREITVGYGFSNN